MNVRTTIRVDDGLATIITMVDGQRFQSMVPTSQLVSDLGLDGAAEVQRLTEQVNSLCSTNPTLSMLNDLERENKEKSRTINDQYEYMNDLEQSNSKLLKLAWALYTEVCGVDTANHTDDLIADVRRMRDELIRQRDDARADADSLRGPNPVGACVITPDSIEEEVAA